MPNQENILVSVQPFNTHDFNLASRGDQVFSTSWYLKDLLGKKGLLVPESKRELQRLECKVLSRPIPAANPF